MPKILQTLFQLPKRPTWRACLLVTAALGCSDTATDPIRMNLADQLWDVRIERRAMTMSTVAPYDTITLRTIAWNGSGDTLTDGIQVHYHSGDPTVRISEDGVLRVRSPTDASGIKIVASVTYNHVTRTDTATVVVTTEPSPLITLDTIVLETISSMWRTPVLPTWSIAAGLEGDPIIVPSVLSNGSAVSNVPLDYVSSDPSIAIVDPRTGEVTPRVEGTARITARTTWYGKTYQTTLDVMVIGAMGGTITIQERIPRGSDTAVTVITPGTLVVEDGALVTWVNESSRPVDIIFDDPTSVSPFTGRDAELYDFICLLLGAGCHVGKTGGNVSLPIFDPNGDPWKNMDGRSFPVPGTYRFQTASGATGTITVKSSLPNNVIH